MARWVERGRGGGGGGGERGETFTKLGTGERGCESEYGVGEGGREREEELYYQRPNGKGLFIVRPIFLQRHRSRSAPMIIKECLSSLSSCPHRAAGGPK